MRKSVLYIPALVAMAAAAALVATGAQAAEVVRCTDAGGAIVYTDGPCPPGSRLSRQVPLTEPVTVIPSASSSGEARRPANMPAPRAALPPPAVGSAPQGPAIIPRNVDEPRQAPEAAPPVYSWGPEPYYDGGRPIVRPRHPRVQEDPGPPPGQRPCQNLAGIKRNNC
ncbi:hypothetical protein [Variovorax paradoxus]|uniref:hypothetical protein n=1 Tax=Variovorax paradoxus TaxID=34073 RepID=UPI00277D52B0|nr:hypothetical protein [Variovorax paradoxus]MDP9930158.1 hypothetical protein [Variovorax paradoxus]